MSKKSAGILAFKQEDDQWKVLLVHPGGPFYAKKDEGVWSVPKGEYTDEEDPLTVARREFREETGNEILTDDLIWLGQVTLKSRKVISVWAAETNFEQCYICSNTFELEWPPRSGRKQLFPEADRAEWFTFEEARVKIHPGQVPVLEELKRITAVR